VHAAVPDSLDSYYQQIGRAGRVGGPAEVTLFYRPEDLNLQTFLTAATAPEDTIELSELKGRIEASPARLTRAVNPLEEVGAGTATESGVLTPACPVEEAVAAAEAWQRLIRSRIQMMRS
jgi:ATP-dependent DNA helicase RecQ